MKDVGAEGGPPPIDISDEALRWVIRLNAGDATARDHAAFAAWRSQDALHELAAREAEGLWNEASGLQQDARTGRLARRAEPRGPSRRKLLGLTGAAVAAGGAGWLSLGGGGAFADYATGLGETRELALPDGSRAFMNARSALNVEYGPGERRVRLVGGEATFQVNGGALPPFRAVTPLVEAITQGAAFNLNAAGDDVIVSVASETVRLRSTSGQTLDLGRSLEAIVSPNGDIERPAPISPDAISSWRTGEYVAENRRLSDVVAALRGYYQGWIVLRDDAAGIRVSAVLDLRRPIASLDALSAALPISVEKYSPYVTVVSRRSA